MASLPTRLTDKQIAELPWLNGTNDTPPKIDVTGHSGNDIARFRDALHAAKIPAKEVVRAGITYVEAATDVPGVRQHLDTLRLRHLSLVDGNGLIVRSTMQFDSNIPLERVDKLFADLRPSAEVGARVENPAALESLQKIFHRYGYNGTQIEDGKLKVLASGRNAQLLEEVGTIKGPFKFVSPESVRFGSASIETTTSQPSYFNAPDALNRSPLPIETATPAEVSAGFMRYNAVNVGIGAAIVTANSALAAEPALRKGEYAEASVIAANTGIRTATELALAAECTAEVATAAAPLAPSGLGYAGAVIAGATVCASSSHALIKTGDAAIAFIQERVKEVAAGNGLDPDQIWDSMLLKAQGNTSKNVPIAPDQER